MIEVEKKFRATPTQIERLLTNAEFVDKKENIDVFFDTADFKLSKKWSWLRDRNGSMELKVAAHPPIDGALCEYFSEYETDNEIREYIELPASKNSLFDDMVAAGYAPFASLRTHRATYRDGEFTIDVDHTTASDFEYDIVEIELMVEKPEDMELAGAKIAAYAESKGLSTRSVNGKLLEYIERKNPEQFQVLLDTGYKK